MSPPRPAATVVLARRAPGGGEVFLLRRSRAVGFLPNAWVFPGGRVDEADAACPGRGGARAAAAFGGTVDDVRPWLVGAVREVFEESGLWLGDGDPGEEARQRLLAGAGLAEIGHTADLDRLRAWAWWVTPAIEPKRYDTRFFLAEAPGGLGTPDAGETVEARWVRPGEAVVEADAGRLPMAPPTWWTLRELAEAGDVDDWLTVPRVIAPIEPIGRATDDGFTLVLPGHPEHPSPAIPGLPTQVRFAQGRWWAGAHGIPA